MLPEDWYRALVRPGVRLCNAGQAVRTVYIVNWLNNLTTESSILNSKTKVWLTDPSPQDCIAGWLCEEMTRDGLELDQMDLGGNTPLHLAARTGNTKTAATLLNHGARVNMKVSYVSKYFELNICWDIFEKIRENLRDSLWWNLNTIDWHNSHPVSPTQFI